MRGRDLAELLVGRLRRRAAGRRPDGYDDASVRMLVDAEYYRRQRGGRAIDAVADYLTTGWRQGLDPHPLFSTSWYLDEHRDVADAGICPLVHYVRHGAREGRSPHPLFDPAYYRGRHPDVADPSIDALAHFLTVGGVECRDPNPWFDSRWYANTNPHVVAGMIPLLDYVEHGWRDGRDPHPEFDVAFYRSSNTDLAGTEPLTHFLAVGRRAGREPCADFALRRLRRPTPAPVQRRRLIVVLDDSPAPEPTELLERCPSIVVTSPAAYEPAPDDDVYEPDMNAVLSATDLLNVAVCLAHLSYDFVIVTHGAPAGSCITSASPGAGVVVASAWHERRRRRVPLPVGCVGRIIRLEPAATDAGELRRIPLDDLGLGDLLRFGSDVVVAGGANVLAPVVARRRPPGPLLTPGEPGPPDWLAVDELGQQDLHDDMRRAVTA
jgi:hypothetical protein